MARAVFFEAPCGRPVFVVADAVEAVWPIDALDDGEEATALRLRSGSIERVVGNYAEVAESLGFI